MQSALSKCLAAWLEHFPMYQNYRGIYLCCLLILYRYTFNLYILDPFRVYSIPVYVYYSFLSFFSAKKKKIENSDLKNIKKIYSHSSQGNYLI